MNFDFLADRWSRNLRACALFLLFFIIHIPESAAVTRFGTESGEKQPAILKLEDIWFYDQQMQKVIPNIEMQWISVVLSSDFIRPDGRAVDAGVIARISSELVERDDTLVDSFYDANLSEDACFFQLRSGVSLNELRALIAGLNKLPFVSYVHPAIRIKNRIFVFFNAFEMKWKTGIAQEIRDRIMYQTYVSFDQENDIYRVDVFQMSFFNAINLLAEDIHTETATPYLVELVPTIRADLDLTINGGNIGDRLPFVFSIEFSDLVDIDPSSIANLDIRPGGIQKELFELRIDPYDYVKTAAVSPVRITGWLKIFTPGEFVIPSVKIKYTCATCSDNQVRSIRTDKVAVKISSVVPTTQGESNLIIPPAYLPPGQEVGHYEKQARDSLLSAVAAFLVMIICIGLFIKTVYASIKEKKRLQEPTNIEILGDNLRKLLHEDPSTPHWAYMARVSGLFRQYLCAAFNLTNAPRGGSGEIFIEAVSGNIPGELASGIRNIFHIIDNAVARELDVSPDLETLRSVMLKVVDSEKNRLTEKKRYE